MYVSRWLGVMLLLVSSALHTATLPHGPTLSPPRVQAHQSAFLLPSPAPTLHTLWPGPSHSSSPQSPLDSSSTEQCTLVISPSQLVVRFGDPLSANCSLESMEFWVRLPVLGWEVESDTGPEPKAARFLVWSVDSLTEWGLTPSCFKMVDHGGHCSTVLNLTVYKPPDNVSISFENHTGPLLAGHQYTLQCHVQDVAPVQNLTVTFYRGGATLGEVQSCRNSTKNSTKSPVSETFTVSINSSREDDGVQYWCQAQLDLGPLGPQPPPVMRSPKLKATVHYGPHSLCPKKLHLREGEALSWEARGNPQPLVTWLRDGKVVALPTHPSREHAGNYTVSAKGALGWLNCTLNVDFLRAKGISNTYCGHFSLAVLLPSIQFIYWVSNHPM